MRFDSATKDCADIGNVGCQCQHDGNETQDFFVERDHFVFLYLTSILNDETHNLHSNVSAIGKSYCTTKTYPV